MRRTTLALLSTLCFASLAAAQLPLLHDFQGNSPLDRFGFAVAGAGDFNGDGCTDLVVGAPDDDIGPLTDAGRVNVYSGADGSILHTVTGVAAFDHFGYAVAGAGDVDNDGFDDVIMGAPGNDTGGFGAGWACIRSGFDGSNLHTFVGASAGDMFGRSVAPVGDLDQDGFDDVIVGAPFQSTNGAQSGRARVFSGVDGSTVYTFEGASASDQLGHAVAGAGDVDDDGMPDFIVGSPGAAPNGAASGQAFVYSGLDGSVLRTFSGTQSGARFGSSVAAAGDVDGDGFDDVIVGAPRENHNAARAGVVRVYSGRTGAQLYLFGGDGANDELGRSVSGNADVNGDGRPDIVAGAPEAAVVPAGAGYARVYSGRDGSVLGTFVGRSGGEQLGTSVSLAGDVNGDQFGDVFVGGTMYVSGGLGAGVARSLALCGAQEYGGGRGGSQTLRLGWHAGPPSQRSAGFAVVRGAAPLATGVAVLSRAADDRVVAGLDLLVDTTPHLMIFGLFMFSPSGNGFLSVQLRQPVLEGQSFYLQTFELAVPTPVGAAASNGLQLLFGV